MITYFQAILYTIFRVLQYISFNVCTIKVGDVMRLKDLREDKDLYQKDIAKLLNTTQQFYSEYELVVNELITIIKWQQFNIMTPG